MKKIFTSLLLIGSMTLSAQTKLDMNTAFMVEDYKATLTSQQQPRRLPLASNIGADNKAGLLVVLKEGADINKIKEAGASIMAHRGNIASVSISVGDIEKLAALDEVKSISSGRREAKLYFARQITSANEVMDGTGEGLTQPYTGQGIITSLVDGGFDPNHINYMNADLTETRVKEFYNFTGRDGTFVTYTPANLADFTTDDVKSSHGTHTSGIMAGSYRGTSKYGLNGRLYTDSPMPYYGLAVNSDILMAAGDLSDANIATGLDNILTYAEAEGRPCVINLSLGGVLGPHDGTDPLCQLLALAGEETIVCVSSGNEGDQKCAVTRSFGGFNKTLRTCLVADDPQTALTAQFWYSTSDPFKIEFVLYDTLQSKELAAVTIPSTVYTSYIDASTSGLQEAFPQGYYEDSYLRFYSYIDENNDRYVVSLQGFLIPRNNASVVAGVRITGTSGQNVNGFISGGTFESNGITGWQDGMTNGSISDLATGENIIAVGAFTSAKTFTLMTGRTTNFLNADPVGDCCWFSSYGPNYQGKSLPDLCAPGSAVISSVNYYNYGPSPEAGTYSAYTDANGRGNQWAAMQGTSMAAPFVSGVCALLLEANPNLTVDEMRTILTETAQLPDYSLTSNEKIQWGAGAINVYEAMKKALESTGVEEIWTDNDMRLMINPTADGYEIFVAGENRLTVIIYDMQGREVGRSAADSNTARVTTNGLASGVYMIEINGSTCHFARKIAVK